MAFGPSSVSLVAGSFDSEIVFRVMAWYSGISFFVGFSGWLGLCVILWKWREKRLVKRVIESDRQVCPRCTYDLRGLPNEHKCPECGSAYDMVVVRSTWLHWWPVALRLDPARKRQRITGFLILAATILIGFGILGLSAYQSLKQWEG